MEVPGRDTTDVRPMQPENIDAKHPSASSDTEASPNPDPENDAFVIPVHPLNIPP